MQAAALYRLSSRLRELIRYANSTHTLQVCLGRSNWSNIRMLFAYSLDEIKSALYPAIAAEWKDEKKVDKEVERGLKQGLYRLGKLLDEIKDFDKEGKHPDSINDSFISSATRELELVLEELEPYSGNPDQIVTNCVDWREYTTETERLIELLLDPNAGMVIFLLGNHGVGKSALLDFVCEDSRIQHHFIRPWKSNCRNESYHPFGFNWKMDCQYPRGQKLLRIFDNANVNVNTNTNMLDYLSVDGYQSFYKSLEKRAVPGSKIVIALRLELEELGAHISSVFHLSGLSPSESWNLFKRTAFSDEENLEKRLQTLSDLGHQICEKCKNTPSVIVIIATILSFKTTPEEWKHFLDVMTSVPDPIPAITYVHQWTTFDWYKAYYQYDSGSSPHEKWHCIFSSCSLLPKDYTFRKNDLLHIWMAQGIHKWNEEGAKENVEQWFEDLVVNGYFIEYNGRGSTVSYKISSLGHELMKHVAGDDYCLVDGPAVEIHHKVVRHISFIVDASWEPPSWLPQLKFLQSLWLWPRKSGDFIFLSKIYSMLSTMGYLHALHAEVVHCARIPEFLGGFKKLKYLRLGTVSTISLPDDIPLLDKLLNWDPCYTSLIDDKRRAQAMLDLLAKFASKKLNIQPEKDNGLDSFEEVRYFMKSLKVQSITLSSNKKLKSKNLLRSQTLETLKVHWWTGEKWPTDDKWLSILTYNLVSIQFGNCKNCRHLPAFGSLPHLSYLKLGGMCSLENIMTSDEESEASSTRTFYPSLKTLLLFDLPKFKGWSTKEGDRFPLLAQVTVKGCPNLMAMPSVPMLKSLEAININAKLIKHLIYPHEPTLSSTSSTPLTNYVSSQGSSPSLVTNLEIDGCIEFDWGGKEFWLAFSCLRSLNLNNIIQLPDGLECITTLEQLSLCWLTNLKALPERITKLRRLTIHYCLKLTKLPNSFSGLEQLGIRYCPRLSQFPESFPNLKRLRLQEHCRFEQIVRASPNLEELEIYNCEDWDYDTQNTEGDSSVRVLKGHNRLRSLKMTKMVSFPKSIDFEQLSELSHLTINSCPNITALPRSFNNPRSLKQLEIRMSPKLEKRCKRIFGEDWHRIQHIPEIICGEQECLLQQKPRPTSQIASIRKAMLSHYRLQERRRNRNSV